MNKQVQAIYEAGVLKPLEPLSLAEHELVSLVIERVNDVDGCTPADSKEDWKDRDALIAAAREADGAISVEQLRDELKSITGSLSDVVISERGEY